MPNSAKSKGQPRSLPSVLDRDALGALEAVGLGEEEARVYGVLLHGPASERELASASGISAESTESVLAALSKRGLVKRLPGRVTRHAVSSPELLLPGLVRVREEQLERARDVVQGLVEMYRQKKGGRPEANSYLEVVAGPEGIGERFAALHAGATDEILGCTKAPLLVTSPQVGGNTGEVDALGRGIRVRWIYERPVLDFPGMLEEIDELAALGERSRTVELLPSRLLIADRATALIPVTELIGERPIVVALITRHPELVHALLRLFELLWTTALPVHHVDGAESTDEELSRCLLAGMKDETIARHLGISRRTLARRISELMNELGVETRLQAGYRLATRSLPEGELATPPTPR